MRIPRTILLVCLFVVLVLSYVFFFSFLIDTFKSKKTQPETPKKYNEETPSPALEEVSDHKVAEQNKYELTDQTVLYAGTPIDGVDRQSFFVFSGSRGVEYVFSDYAKDKNRVYFQGRVVSDADVRSFRVEVNNIFYTFEAEDDHAVFLNGKAIQVPKKEIFLNFFTFPSVGFLANHDRYFRVFDSQLYYYNVDEYGGTFQELLPVKGIQISKARLIDAGSSYVTDDSRMFYQNQELKDADAKTFRIMDGFAKDKKSVYLYEQKIDGADPESFGKVGDSFYFRDRNHVYLGSKILFGADAGSFEEVSYSYGKDKGHVYYRDAIIEGADPASFSPSLSYFDGYAKDKNSVFFLGKRVSGADAASFVSVGGCGGGYASDLIVGKDAEGVYGNGQFLKGMHPESVQVSDAGYVRDSHSIMECLKDAHGAKVQIDSETFRQDGGYFIGKDGVYFEFRKVVGADPEHFFVVRNANRTDAGFVGVSGTTVYIRGRQASGLRADQTELKWCGTSTRYLSLPLFVYDTVTGKSIKMTNQMQFTQATQEQQDILFQNQLAKEEGRPFPYVLNLGDGYSKNAGKISFEGRVIEGADAETFSISSTLYGGWAIDKNFVYWKGKIVGR